MEGKSGEPETIDVSELMKDLEDDENSPRAIQFSKDPLPRQKMASVATARLPGDSSAREPSDVTELPHWWSSFHTQSGLGRSAANPTDSLMGDFSKFGTARSRGGSVGGSSLHTSELFGDKLCVLPQDALAEQLQKSLSFEASPKKEMESIFRQRDSFDARHGKGLKLADPSSLSTSWLLSEDDSALSFSSPSFSSAMSFKRWFGGNSRTVKGQQDFKAMPKTSGSEAQLPPQKAGPPPSRPKSKMTGPSLNTSGASSNAWGYANHDEGAVHPFSSSDRDAIYPMPPSSTGRLSKLAQAGGARRHRHSFTSANREQEFLVDRIPYPVANRPSSWELEKVVMDPKSKVVFYSTSSQTDVHAYEDSNAVRAILISLVGASFDEKSVSQHPEYEQELKRALNTPTALVPTVYVRGRFIAGVDNILNLYKKGALGSMLSDPLAHGLKPTAPCICRGGKFLICPVCKGKRRLTRQGEDSVLCRHCSGTGLIKCPTCLSA